MSFWLAKKDKHSLRNVKQRAVKGKPPFGLNAAVRSFREVLRTSQVLRTSTDATELKSGQPIDVKKIGAGGACTEDGSISVELKRLCKNRR